MSGYARGAAGERCCPWHGCPCLAWMPMPKHTRFSVALLHMLCHLLVGTQSSAKAIRECQQPLANGAQGPGCSSASTPGPRSCARNDEINHGSSFGNRHKEGGCKQSEGSECRCPPRRSTVHQVHSHHNKQSSQLWSRSSNHSDARDAQRSSRSSKV